MHLLWKEKEDPGRFPEVCWSTVQEEVAGISSKVGRSRERELSVESAWL